MEGIDIWCGPNCPLRVPVPAELSAEARKSAQERRQAHLLGHILNLKAGQVVDGRPLGIPQRGIEEELRYVFNDVTNSALNEARKRDPSVTPDSSPLFRGSGPESWGCFGEEAAAELMAEAIRAYLQSPGYLKEVAPNVARRIREYVNVHPEVSRQIHFN